MFEWLAILQLGLALVLGWLGLVLLVVTRAARRWGK
jgi:hypothetical protein